MTKLRLLTIALVVLVVLNIGLIALHFVHRAPEHRPSPKSLVIERLNFDESQVAAYEQLVTDHRISAKALAEQIKIERAQLYSLLTNPDERNKQETLEKLAQLDTQIQALHFSHFEDIGQICRADQKEQFRMMVKEIHHIFSPPPPTKER